MDRQQSSWNLLYKLDGQSLLPEYAVRWCVMSDSVRGDQIFIFEQAILNLIFKSITNPISLRKILTKYQKEEIKDSAERANWLLVFFVIKGQSIQHN